MRLFHRPDHSSTGQTESGRRIRTVVIDDHPIIHEALAMAFDARPDVVFCGGAETSVEAMALIEKVRPDVAIVDMSLGEEHGMDLIKALHEAYPKLRMVVFSLYDEQVYAERAICAGASAYVMKNEPTSTLIEAIREAYRGGVYLSPGMAAADKTRFSSRAVALPETQAEAETVESVLAVDGNAASTYRPAFLTHRVALRRVAAGRPLGASVALLLQQVAGSGSCEPEACLSPRLVPVRLHRS